MTEENPEYFGRDLEAMSFADNYHRWILDEIRPYLGRTIVEVGAGSGNFSRMILETNPDTHYAVEPSSNMYPLLVETLHEHPNAHAYNGYLGEVVSDFSDQPDTAVYINVLEHIEDDRGELELIMKMLKPGGYACIFVPALQWLYGTADANVDHVRRYYMKPMRALVEEAGFEIETSRYFDIAGIIPWWILFCLLKRDAVKAGQVSLYDRLVIPVARRLEGIVTPPLGKNILLIAKKPDVKE